MLLDTRVFFREYPRMCVTYPIELEDYLFQIKSIVSRLVTLLLLLYILPSALFIFYHIMKISKNADFNNVHTRYFVHISIKNIEIRSQINVQQVLYLVDKTKITLAL